MKEKNSQSIWQLSDKLILGIQFLATIVFLFLIQKILPFKFWIVITLALVLINIILFLKLFSLAGKARGKKTSGIKNPYASKKRRVKIISMIISLILVVTSLAAGKGLGVLGNIAGEKYQTHLINILVKADSPYEKINDLDGKSVGVMPSKETSNALKELEKEGKMTVKVEEYSSALQLAEALLHDAVDAVLLNEAYRGLIEDTYGTFSTDTRILYEYEETEILERTDTEINVTKDSFNVFISGIDTYGKVSTVSRSDVNMIVTVNPKTKQILMTSIPRDYYVELASFGSMDKLTHAGIYGVEESMATLEKEFGITIHYYAKVNFSSLVKIVDALGGINVYNDQSFTSYHTHDYYPKGEIYMDGETALEFVRERYGLANGDHDRVKNQQKVLKAMINKAISPAIITNFGAILDAVSGSVATSLESKDIQSLLQMQLNDMATWDIQQVSVNGTGTTSTNCYSMPGLRTYVMKPDYDTVNAAVAKINEVMGAK